MNIEKTISSLLDRVDKLETQCEKLQEVVNDLQQNASFSTNKTLKCITSNDGTTKVVEVSNDK